MKKVPLERVHSLVLEHVLKRGAHIQINQHIRAVSGKGNIALYHNDASIPASDKWLLYKLCFNALQKGDYSKLKGQGQAKGDKRVDPIEASPRHEEAAAPATTRKPPQDSDEPVEAIPQSRLEVNSGDDAAQLRRILQRLAGGAKAEVDPAQIGELVDEKIALFESALNEAFGEKVKKAVSNGSFPTDKVKELITELTAKLAHRIEFVTPSGELKQVDGLVHPQVSQIATWLKAGVPVWAWSAAGSGKTHMARQVAALLEVEPHVVSVDPTLTVSKLMGYRNVANGDFVEGFIYKPFKDGGLLAMDEIDTGDPGVIASANALLSNGHYLFPNNVTIERHAKFNCLALANTKGMGAVAGYTARNRLDAATLDRFAIIEIKYDLGMETALACGVGAPAAPWKPTDFYTSQAHQKAYVEWVQKVREKFGTSVLISPRASINGCKALRAGVPMPEVVEALVFKLCATDSITRIKTDCGLPY